MREAIRYEPSDSSYFRNAIDLKRCRARVTDSGSWHAHQCSRDHLSDSDWCKQHSPESIEARLLASETRYKKRQQQDPLVRACKRATAYRELRAAVDSFLETTTRSGMFTSGSSVATKSLYAIVDRHGDDPADREAD